MNGHLKFIAATALLQIVSSSFYSLSIELNSNREFLEKVKGNVEAVS